MTKLTCKYTRLASKSILTILLLAVMVWCDTTALAHPWRIGIEGGRVNPVGDLQNEVGASYFGGLGFGYQYASDLTFYLQGNYAYLPAESAHFAGLHQMCGRASIEYAPSVIRPLRVGGGFSLAFVRGDDIDEQAKGYMLYDNESEFGWHVRLDMPVILQPRWRAGFRAYWDEIWTDPEASDMLWLGVYMEFAP